MPTEAELVNPLSDWFRDVYGPRNLLLIHEEVRGRGGRRPDMLVVVGPIESASIDDVLLIPVEIENSTKGAIHDPRNGLRQLRKYPGHLKYLAIPSTVAKTRAAREIPDRCAAWGVGLLVVDHMTSSVACEVEPVKQVPTRTLRAYPVAMKRWTSLRASRDVYRRISGQRIVDRA